MTIAPEKTTLETGRVVAIAGPVVDVEFPPHSLPEINHAIEVDIVIDYLWGESAKTVIVAIAKSVDDAKPVRFVHVGGASGEANIDLPGAALRSSAIMLMGSGVKSVPFPALLQSIGKVFEAVHPAGLKIATRVVPLAEVEATWDKAPGKPRVVFSIS